MKLIVRKTFFVAMLAALALAALPFVSASAAGVYDPSQPQGKISDERLERIWRRQLRIYERMGHTDDFVKKAETLIDRARENGKDVTEVQAALDAFESALQDAQPMYESLTVIVGSHAGFDEKGNVTDPAKAQETIQAVREKFQEIKDVIGGTRRELREAMQAFREANPRPQPTPASS
jgi:hypothetical protein